MKTEERLYDIPCLIVKWTLTKKKLRYLESSKIPMLKICWGVSLVTRENLMVVAVLELFDQTDRQTERQKRHLLNYSKILSLQYKVKYDGKKRIINKFLKNDDEKKKKKTVSYWWQLFFLFCFFGFFPFFYQECKNGIVTFLLNQYCYSRMLLFLRGTLKQELIIGEMTVKSFFDCNLWFLKRERERETLTQDFIFAQSKLNDTKKSSRDIRK